MTEFIVKNNYRDVLVNAFLSGMVFLFSPGFTIYLAQTVDVVPSYLLLKTLAVLSFILIGFSFFYAIYSVNDVRLNITTLSFGQVLKRFGMCFIIWLILTIFWDGFLISLLMNPSQLYSSEYNSTLFSNITSIGMVSMLIHYCIYIFCFLIGVYGVFYLTKISNYKRTL